MHFFITGTDTDSGKTYVTRLLIETWRRAGLDAVGFKPFVCGDLSDVIHLQQASGSQYPLQMHLGQHFKSPASPYAASLLENRPVDLSAARAGYEKLAKSHSHVVLEGAGGWEVPLCPGLTLADFASDLKLPILVVVNNKLGCLNHALLTIKAIQNRGLTCLGIILNHVHDERDLSSISNRMVLERFTDVPILGEVMHGETDAEWALDLLR